MKILITTDTIGGVWRYTINLIKSLEKYKAEVHLATLGPLPSNDQLNEIRRLQGVSIYSAPLKLEWMDSPWTDIEKTKRFLLDLSFSVQPDVIHCNSYAIDGNDFAAPVVMVGHSCVLSWWEAVKNEYAPASWNKYASVVKKGLQSAKMVIAPSFSMMDNLKRHYGPFKNAKVIYNATEKSEFPVDKKEKIVFSMGRIWDEGKNIQLLFQAASKIPHVFYIAGDAKNKIDKRALTPNVNLMGQLSTKEINSYLSKAAIFALPVLYEPFGLSALEAALSGCALILGDIPSQREIWKDHAIYCNPKDPSDLASKITRLLDDEVLRNHMSQQALKRASSFLLPGPMAEYYDVYTRLIEESKMDTKRKKMVSSEF